MNEDLVETTIIRLDEGEKIPVNLDIFDGMICLGGPMDTWMEEQYPWMIDEKNKIKEFVLNNQKPYLGICLGCQFLGEILGGKVIKSNRDTKSWFESELEKIKIKTRPSEGNFSFVEMSDEEAKKIFVHLANSGIIVRQLDSYGLPNCLRITIGTREEMEATINSLKVYNNENKI